MVIVQMAEKRVRIFMGEDEDHRQLGKGVHDAGRKGGGSGGRKCHQARAIRDKAAHDPAELHDRPFGLSEQFLRSPRVQDHCATILDDELREEMAHLDR